MEAGLAQRLREGTKSLHREAERAGIMPALLGGRLPVQGFIALQRNLHAIYAELEPALERHAGHASLAAIYQPLLARCDALAADLEALHGASWRDELPLAPATVDYVQRLRQLDREAPAALLAHAYVRYLGDLAGGQALKGVVARALKLDDGRGTGFFEFGAPDQVARLAQAFRAGLAAVPVRPQDIDHLVAEACWAFDQHVLLFRELDAA
jgi:heme oxygenase